MGYAVIHTRATSGMDAPRIRVEVHLANGLPAFHLVGLAETAVKEARERVRGALINSGFEFPARRITVNLAPADIPKVGGRYDLAIALGILVAAGQLEQGQFDHVECAGELSLNGEICRVSGVLPAAIGCRNTCHCFILPKANVADISVIEDLHYIAVSSLLDAFLHFSGRQVLTAHYAQPAHNAAILTTPQWDDIIGQQQAKRALTIAAAGKHNLLLVGPPGTGKSLLASRLLALLPPLTPDEALETATLRSLKGEDVSPENWLQRPFRSPHHTCSAVALTGGGSHPAPGEVSLAHNGILFLDELPEYGRRALDVLREPLETGDITISRAAGQVCYPARFQLVAAMNPSPTGDLHDGRTSPDQILRYLNRLSGPLLDRVDLQINVPVPKEYGLAPAISVENDSAIAARDTVASAVNKQLLRQGKPNALLQGQELTEHCELSEQDQAFLKAAAHKLKLSMRVYHRVIKVARTVADIEGTDKIERAHLAEALGYRALDRMINQLSSS